MYHKDNLKIKIMACSNYGAVSTTPTIPQGEHFTPCPSVAFCSSTSKPKPAWVGKHSPETARMKHPVFGASLPGPFLPTSSSECRYSP